MIMVLLQVQKQSMDKVLASNELTQTNSKKGAALYKTLIISL